MIKKKLPLNCYFNDDDDAETTIVYYKSGDHFRNAIVFIAVFF